jgi:hypothetical protein
VGTLPMIATTINPTTKVTISTATSSVGSYTITSTYSYNTTGTQVLKNAYVQGVGIAQGARVTSVDTNYSLTVDTSCTGVVSGPLTFYSYNDFSYNLTKTGGFAVKDSSSNSQEEWISAITLGDLGAQINDYVLTATSAVSNSSMIFVPSTTGLVVGSYVVAVNVLAGTTITAINSSTAFTVNRNITSIPAGAVIGIHPADQVYYQLGTTSTVSPTNIVLHGQVNQPIQVYGDYAHGNFDLRTPSVFKFYVRSQGYTYDSVTKSDIGITTFTYQAYRWGLSNSSDALYISHTDSQISSNGITPNQSTYNNMKITWYTTPQPRVIGGSTYYFSVIIDADTTVPTQTGFSNTATTYQIYEYVQWALRRGVGIDIDSGTAGTKIGTITRSLVKFVATTLYTIYDSADGGVYIDHFREADINSIVFSDNTNRQFPYVSFGQLTFDSRFTTDNTSTSYKLFYNQINQPQPKGEFVGSIAGSTLTVTKMLSSTIQVGDWITNAAAGTTISALGSGTGMTGTYQVSVSQTVGSMTMNTYRGVSLNFGNSDAQLVKAFSSDPSYDGSNQVKGVLTNGISQIIYDYDWDKNTQCTWQPANRYFVGDEFRYNNGSSTSWYRVKTEYTSGVSWSDAVDGSSGNNTTAITGPTVILVAIGLQNGQYFSQSGTIQKASTNLIAATTNQEHNYTTS